MLEALLLVIILLLTTFFEQNDVVMFFALAGTLLLCGQFVRVMRHKSPPFVPTNHAEVATMIRLADIKPGEIAWDLGCGDGRIVRAAAKAGAVSTGFELSYPTYVLAKILSLRTKNVFIRYANFWTQSYAHTDVIFCFLLTKTMGRFEREIWPTLKPGTRVVSHLFRMPGVPVTRQDGGNYLYVK